MKYKTLLVVFLFMVSVAIYFTLSPLQGNDSEQIVVKPSVRGIVSQKSNTESVSHLMDKNISINQESQEMEATSANVSEESQIQSAPPLEPEIRAALKKILNTSSEGLTEVKKNGVTSVDLQGRFKTAPVATIDESGEIQITDYSHLPE